MKKLGWVTVLALVVIACGSAGEMMGEILDSGVPDAGADPGDGSSMQYVGNSDETFSGYSQFRDDETGEFAQEGRYQYYAACQSTFGPGHRMCTTDEIIFTTNLPQLQEGVLAWTSPGTQDCNDNKRVAVDYLGRLSPADCKYSTNQSSPLRPIACCGPK